MQNIFLKRPKKKNPQRERRPDRAMFLKLFITYLRPIFLYDHTLMSNCCKIFLNAYSECC